MRKEAESLKADAIVKLFNATLEMFIERLGDDNFHKWDGAVYISAIDATAKMGWPISHSGLVLSIEKYFSWWFSDAENKADIKKFPGQKIRPVSMFYETDFHNIRSIPSATSFDYKLLFHGYRDGVGHGILILPERHPFALFCQNAGCRSTGNRVRGQIEKIKKDFERGVIDQTSYDRLLATLMPRMSPGPTQIQ
jgi:hypothetical protein